MLQHNHFNMDWIYLAIAFVPLLYCMYNFFCNHGNDNLSHIQGPGGLPFLGNLLDLSDPKTGSHIFTYKCAQKFKGLFKIKFLTTPIVVAHGYEEILDVFVKKGKNFSNRSPSFRNKKATGDYSEFFATNLTPKASFLKKMLIGHVKSYGSGMSRIEDIAITNAKDMIDSLSNLNLSQPLDICKALERCFTSMTFVLCLGYSPDEEDITEINKIRSNFSKALQNGGEGISLEIFPWLRFFGHPTWKQLQKLNQVEQKALKKWKKHIEVEKQNGEDLKKNFLYVMLEEVKKGSFGINEDNALFTCLDIFLGGTTTTYSTVAQLMNILAQHPEIQAKLQSEVDDVLQDRDPTFQDRNDLPYVYATMLEALRYVTVAPIPVPHEAACDTEITGIKIPKGTQIWADVWTLSHNEEIWGDPFTFRPERYLQEDGALVPPDHKARKCSMVFGAGPRVCPGEIFALTRMLIVISMFIKTFDIYPETSLEKQPSCDCRDMIPGFVLEPNPFKVRLAIRKKN